MKIGYVTLVGAGPGNPDLLTVGGARALAQADVIIADRLIDPTIFEHARSDALVIDAGKRPDQHQLSQTEINEAIVSHARRGHRVVRLKGGDSFVYGRGMEEVDECIAAGIPVSVIPGISSALAAPAAAGISITERGVARTFSIATPAVGNGEPLDDKDIAALVGGDTVSILMGFGTLHETVTRLIDAGRDAETPVVAIQDATMPAQRVIFGTLANIHGRVHDAGLHPPIVLTIGDVAARPRTMMPLNPVHRGPLSGKTIVVTRPILAGRRIADRLRAKGARVIEAPLIRIEYLDPPCPDHPIEDHDWAVFTSLHSVRGLARFLKSHNKDSRSLAGMRVAAIGPKTAEALSTIGINADLVPPVYRATALIDELAPRLRPTSRVLFPAGTLALEDIPDGLAMRCAGVTTLSVYDTLPVVLSSAIRRQIEAGVDAISLYSPTAAMSLAQEAFNLDGVVIASIGPTTANAVRDAGLGESLIAEEYSDDGMAKSLVSVLGAHDQGGRS